jgi:hypothetical protein
MGKGVRDDMDRAKNMSQRARQHADVAEHPRNQQASARRRGEPGQTAFMMHSDVFPPPWTAQAADDMECLDPETTRVFVHPADDLLRTLLVTGSTQPIAHTLFRALPSRPFQFKDRPTQPTRQAIAGGWAQKSHGRADDAAKVVKSKRFEVHLERSAE